MRTLVTGASGMLGTDLCADLARRGHDVIRAGRQPDLLPIEITDREQTLRTIAATRPEVVFHCAAWTDVDGAERDPDGAHAVNATGAGNVAAACAAIGAWMLYVSTDFVFDGEKGEPYLETDAVNPLGAYGASKEAGERLVRETLPGRHAIARTSWLFGPHGKNFVKTIQRLAATRPEVPVVGDQIGCPTHTADLARVLIDLMESPERTPGTYHVSGQRAMLVVRLRRRHRDQRRTCPGQSSRSPPPNTPHRFGSPTRRPAYSVLHHAALERIGLDTMPPWEIALDDYLARISATGRTSYETSPRYRRCRVYRVELRPLHAEKVPGLPDHRSRRPDLRGKPGQSGGAGKPSAFSVRRRGVSKTRRSSMVSLPNVDAILNFAAESHNDRAILNPDAAVISNFNGVFVLLEAARKHNHERFLQVSTDEVYGSTSTTFREGDPLEPNQPYSAAKAGGELMVRAYHVTFGLPTIVTRGSNTFGPFHYPEKLIPLMVTNAIDDQPLPVYGDGRQVREWMHVLDHCKGIDLAFHAGTAGGGLQRRRRQRA